MYYFFIRHHHGTGMKNLSCNDSITTSHENLCVIVEEADQPNYILSRNDAIKALATMRCKKVIRSWTCFVGISSVSILESEYDEDTWKVIWKQLRLLYDNDNPKSPKTITTIQKRLYPLIDHHIVNNTRMLAEIPKLSCKLSQFPKPPRFTPYNIPTIETEREVSVILNRSFKETALELSEIIESGVNFLRVEASEILAFVVTDSERVMKPGLPPHIPVAYGLRGSSLTMKTMRDMVNQIRDELKERKATVLCEVYDGQFHPMIVKNEKGEPLTRIQHAIQHFRTVMNGQDKESMLEKLLLYSQISEDDLSGLKEATFQNGKEIAFDNLEIRMERVIIGDQFVRKIFIETIPINNFSMKHIITYHDQAVWNKYLRSTKQESKKKKVEKLSAKEISEMIQGTKLHRRIISSQNVDENTEISDDEHSEDPDYVPSDESVISEYDSDNQGEETIAHNVSNVSCCSTGQSCIKSILKELQKIKNKHRWHLESADTFISKYLSSKKNIDKLFKYEMDIMNNEIKIIFGKELFKKNDSKSSRVNKIQQQLKAMPELLHFEESEDESFELFQPRRLYDIYHKFLLSRHYPKEYLAAALCKIGHLQSIDEWERNSTIPVHIDVPGLDVPHCIFNYPEISKTRQQKEMRTFDYTHILNNLRYHICNKGFEGIKTEAFLRVSEINHDVLPRTIVEDKLDRQNALISQRFFSDEVYQILKDNGYIAEAEFVSKTRNWFRACDERGLNMLCRMKYLSEMYDYLLQGLDFSTYPPHTSHVKGIPIKTFEALLHTISTRFSLYGLSSSQSYNTRSISTLAIESFFSDLTRYEFSGLGAPKAVDIPKLISHIVHINTTKHDPERGFEFTTSTRDNYPVVLMENSDNHAYVDNFKSNNFDLKVLEKPKRKARWFHLAKPQQVTKGGQGIRQYYRIDETKLTSEQRIGSEINIDNCNI